jgi:hypothetical protein
MVSCGMMDSRAGLDDMEKWKFFTLPWLELPPPPVVQPITSRYTDWANPAHNIFIIIIIIIIIIITVTFILESRIHSQITEADIHQGNQTWILSQVRVTTDGAWIGWLDLLTKHGTTSNTSTNITVRRFAYT